MEAIAAIQAGNLDNPVDIVAAINSHVKELSSDRDKHKETAEKATKNLEGITAAAGKTEGELSQRLADTVADLNASSDGKKQDQEKISALESEIAGMKRGDLLGKVAKITGANSEVLQKLLGTEDKLEISDDGQTVTVTGKSFDDWAKTNHAAFIPALLPEKQQGKLPSGGGNADNHKPPEAEKVSTRVASKKYQGPAK